MRRRNKLKIIKYTENMTFISRVEQDNGAVRYTDTENPDFESNIGMTFSVIPKFPIYWNFSVYRN